MLINAFDGSVLKNRRERERKEPKNTIKHKNTRYKLDTNLSCYEFSRENFCLFSRFIAMWPTENWCGACLRECVKS